MKNFKAWKVEWIKIQKDHGVFLARINAEKVLKGQPFIRTEPEFPEPPTEELFIKRSVILSIYILGYSWDHKRMSSCKEKMERHNKTKILTTYSLQL